MTTKARVHELARELGISSRELLATLTEMGEFVRSTSSTLEAPVVRRARAKLGAPLNDSVMTGADVPASAESTPGAPAAKSELQPASTWYQPTAERITGTLPTDLECDFWQVTVQIQSSGLLDRCDLGCRFDQCVTDWVRTHLVEELTSDPEPTIGRITQSRLRTRPRIRDAMDTQIARWCRNALPGMIRGDLAGTDHLMESSWLLEQIGTARIYEACLVQWLQDGFPAAGVDLAGLGPHARSVIIDHVVEWCRENVAFGSGRPFVPNREQAAVIATTGQHALVAARAGSGKTATMVARTVFLIKGRGADPKSIMMLAFNKDAAKEIETRLASQLGPEQLPYVLTFHALAHRIVHPTGTLLADAADASGTGGELSHFVDKRIDELMITPSWEDRVREVMLEYFKGDWERIEAFEQVSARQGLAERAGLARESIKGDFVKSYGEKAIANALYLNGFTGDSEHTNEWTYKYEADVFWNGANYKPDFMIFGPADTSSGKRRKRMVIEYFGMVGDPEYDAISEKKRGFWADRNEKNPDDQVVFLEYFPWDAARPGFVERLLADLRDAGVPRVRRLGDDEMWERVKKHAVNRFTRVVEQIISRSRQRGWDSAQLKVELCQAPHDAVGPGAVTELAADVLGRYEAKLADSHSNDFPGLMWQAINKVRAGGTKFGGGAHEVGSLAGLRHIVIDEFQDFSLMFDELIQAILAVAPGCTVMTVGDDWQAINEFAGSDTRYFHDFEKEFPGAQRLELVTNRRSAKAIVKAGNTLMSGRGTPAKPAADAGEGVIRTFDLDGFWPTADEQKLFDACDRLTPALLRLIAEHLAHGRTVAVLRRNGHGRFVHFGSGKAAAHQSVWGSFDEYGSKFLELLGVEDSDSVHFGTIHSFKGQEADAVILVDVDDHNHPFVHPTWQMLQVFGDTPEKLTDAERRLFYVGISRPREYLDVLTSASGASPFWKAFSATLAVLPDMPGALSPDDRVEILVSNALGPDLDGWRADLKSSGFTWRGAPDDCWSMTTDMDWRHLLDADSWAKQAGTQITVIQQDRVIHEHFVPDEASQ